MPTGAMNCTASLIDLVTNKTADFGSAANPIGYAGRFQGWGVRQDAAAMFRA